MTNFPERTGVRRQEPAKENVARQLTNEREERSYPSRKSLYHAHWNPIPNSIRSDYQLLGIISRNRIREDEVVNVVKPKVPCRAKNPALEMMTPTMDGLEDAMSATSWLLVH
jgi:hypothetical protein